MKKNNFFRGMLPILAVGVMALAGTSLTSCSRSSDDELVVPQTPSVSVQDVVGTWKLTKYERKIQMESIKQEQLLHFIKFIQQMVHIKIIIMRLLMIHQLLREMKGNLS